ncbi:hypothetical protein OBV_30240 [Oscillibacter valericigenes Sjm18-20]|nr:hypothetical protein OBV_30240 [Oscillibacter valericigenes Sjm18-20]
MSRRSPRLRFSEEERAAPELKKAVSKADQAADRLEKAETRIPKKSIRAKETVVDSKTGAIKKRPFYEEVDKKKPPSKLTHALRQVHGDAVLAQLHHEIHESEQDNVGVESAHKLEGAAETSYRAGRSAYRSHRLKPYRNTARAETKADKANVQALRKEAEMQNPQLASNPYSRWQQKRAIKQEYAAAKAAAGTTNAAGTVNAAETTAKATKKAAEKTKKAGEFVAKYKKTFLILGGAALIVVLLLNFASSCSILVQSGTSSLAISTYPSQDSDMLAAEAQYAGMEAALQSKLDNYTATHDYDEYHFDLDTIEHDPYVLVSLLTALQGHEWTIRDVQSNLAMLFDRQYTLTETVTVETRYRTETRTGTNTYTDPDTGVTTSEDYEYDVQVPYNYYICHVKLENFNLSHVPVYILSEDQLSMYSIYMATLGNRPDLFPGSAYIGKYINGSDPVYEIPPEALSDETFAAIIKEANKYVGYPYVWGGSSPSTSFDCSGFVSWVINHSGWNVGRLGAQGLYNICTPVSPANAKPGDLIFFEHTYHTDGVSHVGIYVGNNMMIHCGDPIKYSSIDTSYWQQHFYAFGRLPGN